MSIQHGRRALRRKRHRQRDAGVVADLHVLEGQSHAQYAGDAKAMTMLGELYANGLGVKRDYAKAADWYQQIGRAHV